MTTLNHNRTIWFVYDGQSILCTNAALALKINKKYATLCLIDSRKETEHFVIKELNKHKIDLDEVMIAYDGNRFYHGKNALSYIAKFTDNKQFSNLINKSLFCSKIFSCFSFIYPFIRAFRNPLQHHPQVNNIHNLNLKSEPIFKSIFGESWNDLPPVMHKHYLNRPYTYDINIVTGNLDVMCSGPIKFLAPLLWLTGGVPPINAHNVPVTVSFLSNIDSKHFTFNRIFYFSNRKPYLFQSRMIQIHSNNVVELMSFGIGWKTSFHWEDGYVKLKHNGYILNILGYYIPIPLTFLIGQVNAFEKPIDDHTFDMQVDITHPIFGNFYHYKGRFHLKDLD